MDKNVEIIVDSEGLKTVFINRLMFLSRRQTDWNTVEEHLKDYIGKCFEIMETSEKVFIALEVN